MNPGAAGFLTVYPCDAARPNASNVNYQPGQVVPNAGASTGATVDGVGQSGGLAEPGSTIEWPVSERAGVPGDASAVVLNVTVTEAQAPGFVTVYPCGSDRPLASSLNFVAGSTVPNGVIAKVGAGGKVCLYTSAGTHVIADLNGWFVGA